MRDELTKILDQIFVYGVDWTEYKDKSKNDHSVSTFAGKVKAEHKQALLTSIINLVDKEVIKLNEELLDALEDHKKTLDYIVKDGAPRNPTNYEVYLRKAIEVDSKIAQRAIIRGKS